MPWTNPALPLGRPLPALNPTSLATKTERRRSHPQTALTATGSESVTLGQTLVWNRPPWIEPDSPQHFEVLFEDPYLFAVNKPSGLPTLPGGGFMENTLLRLVQKQTPNANPVHRLGRATTGIVLFAKTPQAASNLFRRLEHTQNSKNLPGAGAKYCGTTPTKSSHPSAWYRTRASVPCGPPTQMANRQSHWQR